MPAENENYTINDDGTVTLHWYRDQPRIPFSEFVMAYAPISFIEKFNEPLGKKDA